MPTSISRYCLTFLLSLFILGSCNKKNPEIVEKLYSRHLQQHYTLTIVSTPIKGDKKDLNLVLLNDGQDMKKMRVKEILDSLWDEKLIQPCVIVGIHASERMQEYGVSDQPDYEQRGSKAGKYAEFFNNELYPFIKKKSGVRKFKSVSIAGWSLGGLSAFDLAWTYPDKIDKVGVFSGSFWWRDKDVNDSSYSDDKNRIMINKIHRSRKKPHLKYWFYVGGKEEKDDRDKDGVPDIVDDTRDLIELLKSKNICPPEDIIYKETQEGKHDFPSWSKAFPEFLVWATK